MLTFLFQIAAVVAEEAEKSLPTVQVEQATSPHIDLPIWAVPIVVGAFLALIAYVWHRLEDRIKATEVIRAREVEENRIGKAENQIKINTDRLDRLEVDAKDSLKIELEKGGFLTVKDHSELCQLVCGNLAKVMTDKFESFEQNLDLKLENLSLGLRTSNRRAISRIGKKGGKK